ncbi:hypothetical protein ACIBCA_13980 [Kitasatospora sp. NPDC051170]|uniref:hypothetical protein n=1 Tax=Kitasatospora sp. NPDC051170 TaxID=3364056 RepID=UPI0037B67CE6
MFDTTKKLRKVAGAVAGTALAGLVGLGVVSPTLTDDTHWGAGATDTVVTTTTDSAGGPVKPADTHWG